uniref:Tudor domain-containing protein 3 n=1 Tax=Rhipicephalus appendiculatus TaxID=34631 RepID=A0A131YF42_RHIAP
MDHRATVAALLSSSSISLPRGIVDIRNPPEGKAITRTRTICTTVLLASIPTMRARIIGTGALKKVVDHRSSHGLIKGTTGVTHGSPLLTGGIDGAPLRLVTWHLAQDLHLAVVTGALPTQSHLAPSGFSLDRKCWPSTGKTASSTGPWCTRCRPTATRAWSSSSTMAITRRCSARTCRPCRSPNGTRASLARLGRSTIVRREAAAQPAAAEVVAATTARPLNNTSSSSSSISTAAETLRTTATWKP